MKIKTVLEMFEKIVEENKGESLVKFLKLLNENDKDILLGYCFGRLTEKKASG